MIIHISDACLDVEEWRRLYIASHRILIIDRTEMVRTAARNIWPNIRHTEAISLPMQQWFRIRFSLVLEYARHLPDLCHPSFTCFPIINMGIYVLFTVLFIRSVHRHVLGAYPLESDVSRMTGVEPPKKWLVFLEAHILRCMKLRQQPPARSRKDLLSVFHCLGITQKWSVRCYFSAIGLYRWLISPNILRLKAPTYTMFGHATCQNLRGLDVQIFIHNMFYINFTLTNFFLDSFHPGGRRSRRNYCHKTPKLVISFNNRSDVFCATRYPKSILINSDRMKVAFSIDLLSTFTHIIGVVEVMDRYFVQSPLGLHTQDLITWGDFNVRIYRISVEMLYQMELSVSAGSHVIIHDGPSLQMPQLRTSNQSRYISSTFQVIVVAIFRDRNISSQVSYQADSYFPAMKSTPQEEIFLKNNSGCGNSSARFWMCTFKIISSQGTQVSVEMIQLDIAGPYAYMYLSAGVAVYNVINNTTNLVIHVFYNLALNQRPLAITGSENTLYLSAYAYFPYTLLSLKFVVKTNHCIGKFIRNLPRSSITTTSHDSESSGVYDIWEVHFHMALNITHPCYAIHVNIPPWQRYKLFFHFRYDTILRLLYDIYGNGAYFMNIHAFGKYQLIYGGYNLPHCAAHGDIRIIAMEWRGSAFADQSVATVNISRIECLQPCRAANSTILSVLGIVEICDVCRYFWLDDSMNNNFFATVPNEVLTLERIHGDLLATITISSLSPFILGGHKILYRLRDFSFCFRLRRILQFSPQKGQIWRVGQEALLSIARFDYVWPKLPMITHARFHRREYEYILVEMPTTYVPNRSSRAIQCSKYAAAILTIQDYQELRFVVRNIMQPMGIERIYISQIYKVCQAPIASFMGPTWGPSGADRTQVGPMLAPWTLLSGRCMYKLWRDMIITNTMV